MRRAPAKSMFFEPLFIPHADTLHAFPTILDDLSLAAAHHDRTPAAYRFITSDRLPSLPRVNLRAYYRSATDTNGFTIPFHCGVNGKKVAFSHPWVAIFSESNSQPEIMCVPATLRGCDALRHRWLAKNGWTLIQMYPNFWHDPVLRLQSVVRSLMCFPVFNIRENEHSVRALYESLPVEKTVAEGEVPGETIAWLRDTDTLGASTQLYPFVVDPVTGEKKRVVSSTASGRAASRLRS